MGKKAKERKQTQVSPDYISAAAGNSGILRDMAGHFAGTGRYVVPAITAACAMQGMVMPVCQAYGMTPTNGATLGSGDIMFVQSGTVRNITVSSGGYLIIEPIAVASNTIVSGTAARMAVSGDAYFTTLANNAELYVYGALRSGTDVNNAKLYVANSGVANSTIVNSGGDMTVWGRAWYTTVNSGGSMHVTSHLDNSIINSTTVNGGSVDISSGGSARSIVIDNGGTVMLMDGTVSNTTLNSGTFSISSGGLADITNVNSGGSMTLTDGSATNTTVDGGLLTVSSGGFANSTIVDLDGTMMVLGGYASDTTVNSGILALSSGGSADITNVNSGGSMTLTDGSATNTTVNGGSLTVSSGGLATTTTVDNGGAMTLVEGIASNTTVNSGTLAVNSGGSADTTTLSSGGSMVLTDGSATNTTVNGGSLAVSSGGIATTTTVDNGGAMTLVEGTASNTTVNSGTLSVNSGGSADITIVNSGGSMTLTDGSVTNTTVDGGSLTVSSGGLATSTTVDNNGSMTLVEGAASNTTVNSGTLAVISGGSADIATVNIGGSMTLTDGSATNTYVSGGLLEVSSGGKIISTTVDDGGSYTIIDSAVHSGYVKVFSGGSAENTVLNNRGVMLVSEGGIVTDTTINLGFLIISSGGIATSTTLDLGNLTVHSGGSATDVNVSMYTSNVGGFLDVGTGGFVKNVTFSGPLEVMSGRVQASIRGEIIDSEVNSGGFLRISTSGLGTNLIVNSDGFLEANAGGAKLSNTTINSGGNLDIRRGATAIGTNVSGGSMRVGSAGQASFTNIVNNGSMTVVSGGVASDTVIDLDSTMMVVGGSVSSTKVNNGTLAVTSGGLADTTTVNSGGSMTLADGSATNTTLSGGSLSVSSGGLATSTTVDSGGSMTVSSGGAASSTDIINGGSVTVNGGSVTDTAISSGIMEVISSGLAADTTVYNGGSLSVTGNSTVNNVVLSGGTFTNPNAGTNAFISGTVSGDGNITGPGDFTIANGNILLNSGSISTTGNLTIDKVLDTTKPAVSATTINVGGVDVTNLDTDTATGGTLIAADTGLAGLNLISGTTNAVLSSDGQNVTFDGGVYTDTSIPGFTLDYKDPSVTYSLVNSTKEIEYSITGNKQATRLTFGSIGWLDSGAFINHTNQFADIVFSGADVDTANIHFNNVDSLQANKTMTLVSDFGNSVGTITGTKYTVGTTLQGNGKAELVGNDLVYKVETDSVTMSPKTVAQEQTHNTLMGMEAGLAVINSGQEFIEKAVDGFGDINNIGNDGIAVYAGMGVSKDRYETGSHINMNTWNGIIGVGKANELPDGKIQWGGFLEHGSGNFSIHSDTNSRGDGSSTYTGGGVVAKWTNKHDVYTEAGLRYGSSHDNASNVLQDALGKTYGYDVRANYYGGYLGLGKIYRLGKDRILDVYGKFFSTHRDGVSFDAGGRYELDALQSNILRVGAKYGVKSGKVNWYGGLAYEHEFSGEATGKADGLPIRSASIKGGSLRMDLGATIKPSEKSPWTMRMGITGHTGKHRGIGGSLMLSCNF